MSHAERLKTVVGSANILDDESQHHEFASGLHGRKLDFDKIETGGQDYEDWTEIVADYIRENYPEKPFALLGTANGANRLALSVAAKLGGGVIGLTTLKISSNQVKLTPASRDIMSGYTPDFVLGLDDVGTTGGTLLTGLEDARNHGAARVEGLNSWQRSRRLNRLDDAGIRYRAVVHDTLPSYQPDACELCKAGVKLIRHS